MTTIEQAQDIRDNSDNPYVRQLASDFIALTAQLDAAKSAIEYDRSAIADGVTAVTKVLDSRYWLTEGRGSYEWDDDRYQKEFLAAGQELIKAIAPLKKIAADLKNSPQTTDEVIQARRDLKAENDRLTAAYNEEKARLDALIAEVEKIRRTPAMPFPDRDAHSERAFGNAVWTAWSRIQQIACEAIDAARKPAEGPHA